MSHLIRKFALLVTVAVIALMGTLSGTVATAQTPVTIDFYFPEATANNAQAIFEEYAKKFTEKNPNITVKVAYQGSYTDNRTKIQTELQAGKGPDVAVMLTTDLYSFIEAGTLIPAQQFVDKMTDGKAFVADHFPGFLLNGQDVDGKVWSVPFQRSTPVLFYNKDMFKEAGLDPNQGPRNRDELVSFAKKLNKGAERWGFWLPTEGFPIWLFSASLVAAKKPLITADPTQVFFNTPEAEDALKFWLALSKEHKVMPEGTLSWGDTPTIFTSGKAAMAYHTTGSLARILREAKFEVGVSFLASGAGKEGFGTPTGGGNLYLFKNSTPAEQEAAWKWIEFLASPEIQADWGAKTGYVAARKSAWELEPLKSLAAKQPQYLIARDQLQFAEREFTAYRTIDIQNIINKTLSDVLSGKVTDVKGELDKAQKQIDSLLAEYKKK